MSYVTAVTDRVLSDATTPTSKGRLNVSDWTRIYGNTKLTNSFVVIETSTPIVFNLVAAPTTSTAMSSVHTMTNTLLANIERLRLAVVGESVSGTSTEIIDDWMAGIDEDAPDYTDANLWESTVDAIWTHYGGPDLEVCPTLTGDLIVLTGTYAVFLDCINTGSYNINVQGTGTLYIL